MTALFPTRRRAEQLAAAVDGHIGDVSHELRPLVGVATALRSVADVEPRPEFTAELRSLLVAEAERALGQDAPLALPVRHRGPRERRLVAAASVAVLLGGTAGMAAAAQDALPGEALYPVKRGIEQAEASLSVSTAGRGQDLLDQADGRLLEVRDLLGGPPAALAQVPGTVEDFTEQAQEGAQLLFASFEETGDPTVVVEVRRFAATSIEALQRLARTAPAEAQDELAAAALTLKEIDRRAAELCAECGADLPALQVPGIFLAAADVDRVLSRAALLPLDNSHPVVVDKRLVRGVTGPVRRLADGGEQDGPDAPTGPTAPAAPGGVEDGPLVQLPGDTDVTNGDQTAPDPVRKVAEDMDKTVDDLSDGLTGVVETVLPDPLGLGD